jgi:thymidine kinase
MSINSEQGDIENGKIEVICGCMFSGKTEEFIKRIKEAKVPAHQIKIFKPEIENRYHDSKVVSHNGTSIDAILIKEPKELLAYSKDTKVVGIDEAQFFDNTIVEVCNTLANMNIRVIVAGLDMDYLGKPFGPMPYLLAVAEEVTKLHAVCNVSGGPASFSYRKNNSNENILLGANEYYEARSRRFFYENHK